MGQHKVDQEYRRLTFAKMQIGNGGCHYMV